MQAIRLVVACVVGVVAGCAPAEIQGRSELRAPPCATALQDALRAAAAAPGRGTLDVDPQIRRAMTLFRLHRRADALAKLKWVETLLSKEYGPASSDEKLEALARSISELKECIDRSSAAPLATLTIRVLMGDPAAPDDRGPPAGKDVLILVGDIIVGRTASDGTLRLRVPSGVTELRAEVHDEAGAFGAKDVDLAPGASAEVAVVLGEGADPFYATDLVVLEAVRGTIEASSRSLTLEFVENGVMRPISRVIEVELLDADLRELSFLTERFRATGGRIVSSDLSALLALLPRNEWIHLAVTGQDTDGVYRHNLVRLRVQG